LRKLFQVLIRLEAKQAQSKSVLTLKRAVAGPIVATQLSEQRHNVPREFG
jgi:hypothetical protein